MNSPIVSVIMATYNHADFVKQSIESVLAQQDVEFEFLIADDGSSDSTREVVSLINDKRIQFFPNLINRGACIVTNDLINRASGKYIALINSDDYWSCPDKLAHQVQIMEENPSLAACFSKANFVNKNGVDIDKNTLSFGTVFDQKNRSQGEWLRQFFDFGNCICHPTMLIRKSCYDEVGLYNNRMRQLPDLDMWVRLIKKYQIYTLDKDLINFRILPGENVSSPTGTNIIRTLNEHYLIAENFFKDVTREQLIEGFSDCLIYKDIPSLKHLEIEKVLLYFQDNQKLGNPYKVSGITKMNQLLNNPTYYNLLVNSYGIDDSWFQKQLGEIDVLCAKPPPPPKPLIYRALRRILRLTRNLLTRNKPLNVLNQG